MTTGEAAAVGGTVVPRAEPAVTRRPHRRHVAQCFRQFLVRCHQYERGLPHGAQVVYAGVPDFWVLEQLDKEVPLLSFPQLVGD